MKTSPTFRISTSAWSKSLSLIAGFGLLIGAASNLSATSILNQSSVSQVTLPSWTDSSGTVYLEDGFGNKRAMSWSPTGYVVTHNGTILEKYPEDFPEPPHTQNNVYYVDATNGNDSNNGESEVTAWKTINHVNTVTFAPGDEVLFKRGETWNVVNGDSMLKPKSSGASDNVIKIGAYGTGNRPVFDAGGVYWSCIWTHAKSNLWITELRLTGAKDKWGSLRIGEKADFAAPYGGIWVTDCEIDNNTGAGIGVTYYSDGTYFKDLYIHHNNQNGIFLNWAHDGSTVDLNDGNHQNHYTVDCVLEANGAEVDDTNRYGWNGIPSSGAMYGNIISEIRREPLYFNRGGIEGAPTISTFRIHDNEIYDGRGGYCYLFSKSSSRIYRNVLHDTGENYGLASDQVNGRNAVIHYHHNLVYDIDSAGIYQGGANRKEYQGGTFTIHTWNNTADEHGSGMFVESNWAVHEDPDDSSSPILYYANPPEQVTLDTKNNLFSRSTSYFMQLRINPGVESYDYNAYYSDLGASFMHGYSGKTWAQWQALGFDAHSVHNTSTSDPGYVNQSGRDYNLQSGSTARGAGTDLLWGMQFPASWIGINYVPHATSPDIGAYQYLAGKTLDFSKFFLGLRCNGGTAGRIQVWDDTKSEAELLTLTNVPPDTAAPSTPTGLVASNVTATTVDLDWNASSDNYGVAGYYVYANGVNVGAAYGVSVTVPMLNPETEYTFTVAAFDASGNESAASAGATVTTLTTGVSEDLYPTDDAYVRGGSYQYTNFGSETELQTKNESNLTWTRKSYLKFDFGSFTDSTVASALLSVEVVSCGTDATRTITLYGTNDENWSEDTITWSNAPNDDTVIDSQVMDDTVGTVYYFDVTNYVINNMDDKVVSFLLINEGPTSSQSHVIFNSKEAGSGKPTLILQAPAPALTVNPSADAYIRGGSYDSTNFGTATELQTKSEASDTWIRESYLKFDFGSFTGAAASSAKLRVQVASSGTDVTHDIGAYSVTDESWTENGITWRNAPTPETTALDTVTVSNTVGIWYEFDVTSLVNANMSDKIISVALINIEPAGSQTHVFFNSREASSGQPELVIEE